MKQTRAAAVLGVAALALTLPASAAPNGVTTTIPGLGRATELDLVARAANGLVVVEPGSDLAHSAPVAYGVGASAPGTVDLTSLSLPTRAWSAGSNGRSAIVSTPSGLTVAGEPGRSSGGTVVGYVYRRTAESRLATVRSTANSADPTVVDSNLDAGGAISSWTYRGVQYVNGYDYGRQIQSSLFAHRDGSTYAYDYNPTEAGDEWSNVLLDPDLRHGSPLASASTTGARQSTRAIPLEWSPLRISPAGEAWTPVLYQDVRIGKDLTLDAFGMSGVARYRTVLSLPQALDGSLEIPTTYLRGEFSTYYGVDAVAGLATPLVPEDFDPSIRQTTDGLNYVPTSGRGGVVAATIDGGHAMGIYGVTTSAGGPVSTFAVHDFVPNAAWQQVPGFGNGPHDFSTSKLRAMRTGSFPAGTTTYETYIVTGTLDEVVARMQALSRR